MGSSFGSHSYTFDGLPASWTTSLTETRDILKEVNVSLEEIHRGCVKTTRVSRVVHKQRDQQPIREDATITVNVKPGCAEGTAIRFQGQGDQLINRPAGDVVVVVKQKPHSLFKRHGNDISYTANITTDQALLYGTVIVVPSLSGRIIPLDLSNEVINPSTVKVLTGCGLPYPEDPGRRGKMYVHFDISCPKQDEGDGIRDRLLWDKISCPDNTRHGDGKRLVRR